MPRPSTATFTNTAAQTKFWESRGLYTGAGASVPVKVRGKGQTLTRQGVGLYTLTFVDVGGQLCDLEGVTHTAATVAPGVWKANFATYSAATKSVAIEHYLAGVLADPAATAGTTVALTARFFDNLSD